MSLSCVKTNEGISVFCNGEQHNVRREHIAYKQIVGCVNNGDADGFLSLLSQNDAISKIVVSEQHGKISYKDGNLYVDGKPVDKSAYEKVYTLFLSRIESHLREGLSITPILAFLNNLMENPSRYSIEQAYDFIERNELPLTEDGYFLAYKCVQHNYLDKHSSTFSNKPGSVLKMARNMVDDNPRNHCSHGFHVGALKYSGPNGSFYGRSDKVVTVKVNPRDIVSVPADHDCQKCRVCEYEVLADYSSPLLNKVYDNTGSSSVSSYAGEMVDDFDLLYEDDDIMFKYSDEFGNEEIRRGSIDHLNTEKETVTCIMSNSDKAAGEYRSFKWCRMFNVKLLS